MRRAPSSSSGTPSSPHQDERFNRYADASEPFFHQSQAPSWSDQYLPSQSLYSSTSAFPTFPALPQYDFQQYYQAAHQYPPYHSNQLTHIEQTLNSDNYNHMNSRNQVGLDGMMQSFNSVLHHTNEHHPYQDYRQMQTLGQSQYSYGSATHFDWNIGTHVQSGTSSTRHKQFKDPDPFAMHSCLEEEESVVRSHYTQSDHRSSGRHDRPRDPDPFAQSYDEEEEGEEGEEEDEEAFIKELHDSLSHSGDGIHSDSSGMESFLQSIYDDEDQFTNESESVETKRHDFMASSPFGKPDKSHLSDTAQTSEKLKQLDYNQFPFTVPTEEAKAMSVEHGHLLMDTSQYIWWPWKQEIPEEERAPAISALFFELRETQGRFISEVSEQLCVQSLKRNASRRLIRLLLHGSRKEKCSATKFLLEVPEKQKPSREQTWLHVEHMRRLLPSYTPRSAKDYLVRSLKKNFLLKRHLYSANQRIRDDAFQRWWNGRRSVILADRKARGVVSVRDQRTPLTELFGEDHAKQAEVVAQLWPYWGGNYHLIKIHLSKKLFQFPNMTRRLLNNETFFDAAVRLASKKRKEALKTHYNLTDKDVMLNRDIDSA